ncbi:MAG: hypothetical protein ACM359_12160 [Bacillota bacterium]
MSQKRDYDNDKKMRKPRAWRDFKALFGGDVAEFAVELEKMANGGDVRWLLGLAMFAFIRSSEAEQIKAFNALCDWHRERREKEEAAQAAASAGAAVATKEQAPGIEKLSEEENLALGPDFKAAMAKIFGTDQDTRA